MSMLACCLHFHFNLRECPRFRRRSAIPKLVSIMVHIVASLTEQRMNQMLQIGIFAYFNSVLWFSFFMAKIGLCVFGLYHQLHKKAHQPTYSKNVTIPSRCIYQNSKWTISNYLCSCAQEALVLSTDGITEVGHSKFNLHKFSLTVA